MKHAQFTLLNLFFAVGVVALLIGLARFASVQLHLRPLLASTTVATIALGCWLVRVAARMKVKDNPAAGLRQGLICGAGCLIVFVAVLFAVAFYLADRFGFE